MCQSRHAAMLTFVNTESDISVNNEYEFFSIDTDCHIVHAGTNSTHCFGSALAYENASQTEALDI